MLPQEYEQSSRDGTIGSVSCDREPVAELIGKRGEGVRWNSRWRLRRLVGMQVAARLKKEPSKRPKPFNSLPMYRNGEGDSATPIWRH